MGPCVRRDDSLGGEIPYMRAPATSGVAGVVICPADESPLVLWSMGTSPTTATA
jgi:hypothetical protein